MRLLTSEPAGAVAAPAGVDVALLLGIWLLRSAWAQRGKAPIRALARWMLALSHRARCHPNLVAAGVAQSFGVVFRDLKAAGEKS